MANTKKILVTGGAGYIGSHTCVELLEAGFEPIIIDDFSNSSIDVMGKLEQLTGTAIQLLKGDCKDYRWLSQQISSIEGVVGIIHFAAFKAVGESTQKPLAYFENNVESTINMLKLMKEFNIPSIVFSSSCTVYGEPDELPVSETSPMKPAASPYGRTKQICEQILQDTLNFSSGINGISLRYFNPIGAHPSALIGELPLGVPNNLVPFITQTAAGIRVQLTVFGDDYNTSDGTCVRDYIHVVDLAKAHVAALNYLLENSDVKYDVVNIGTGKGHTVLEVVKTFESANNLKLNYTIGPRRGGDIEKVYADAFYAKKLLNWEAELSLEQALVDAWKWQKTL